MVYAYVEGGSPVVYASVNNGIFLCEQCGMLHMQLPENVSRVKSIQYDKWSDLDIDLLVNGGNKRLWDLLMAYSMPRDAAFEFKYLTKLGYYYRYMLMAIVKGQDPGAAPDMKEALLPGTEQTQKREGKPPDFWGSLDYYSHKSIDYTKKAFDDIKKTVSDPGWQQKVIEGTKEQGAKIGTTLSNAAVGTKNFFVNAKKEADEKGYLNTAKTMGEKGLEKTKKGLSSAFGFISKQFSGEPQRQEIPVNQGMGAQPNYPYQGQGAVYQQEMGLNQQYPGMQPAEGNISLQQQIPQQQYQYQGK